MSAVSKILTYYLIQLYLLKKSITSPPLMFSWKIYAFSEAVTRGVLWKKLFLKFFQCSQERCRHTTLLKTGSKTGISFEYCKIFKNTYIKEHLLTAASDFLKQLQNSNLLLSSGHFLTGYEQLSYLQFNRSLSICVSLAKDWFELHKKFSQELAT